MPIDEDLILSFMEKMTELISKDEVKRLKTTRILISLQSIRQRTHKIQNETSGEIEEKKIVIIDPGIGKPITTERRQEVYDASIAEARKILGITTPN